MKRPFIRSTPDRFQLLEAFEYHVMPEPNCGCHIWIGPIFEGRGGYGVFTCRPAGYVMARAHRVSWEIKKGPIPQGLHVLHSCDMTYCVNEDHLFIGTQADNMRDKAMKGRQCRGENHGSYIHGRYVGDNANPLYRRD